MTILLHLFRHAGRRLILATLAGLCGGLSSAALVTIIGRGVTEGQSRLGIYALAFLATCAATLVFRVLSENMLLRCTQDMILDVRLSLSHRLVEAPLHRLQRIGKAELLVILTQDVESFAMVARTLPRAFGDGIVIAACFGYLAWLSPTLFAIFAAYLVLGVVSTQLGERPAKRHLLAVRVHVDALYRHFRSLIEGSRELRLNAARADMFVDTVIAPTARQFRESLVRAMTAYNWVANAGSVLFYVAIGLAEFLLPLWLPLGNEVRISSMVVLLYLVQPVTELISMLPILRQATIAYGRLVQLDDRLGTGAPPALGPDPFTPAEPLHVALRGVRYRYDEAEDNFDFGPVDLDLRAGEALFVVGGNGSGKTTLALLLLGLLDPDEGSVELNGHRVTAANLQHYRAHFSAVFYDFHLFDHLVGRDPQDAAKRARYYVEELGLSGKVEVIGNRFSTTALSSGQRRRLALVSAYVEDRPVYLFDEWAADQDPEFRHAFYSKLLPELKERGKTIIVITHDERYFALADRIVRLDRGRVSLGIGEAVSA